MELEKNIALQNAAEEGQAKALGELFEYAKTSTANFWGVVDFNKPSSEERLYIFNLKEHTYKKFLVAHGKNSGEKYATAFSNNEGSLCSSLGIYKTLSTYTGKHGESLKISGLEDSNSNAEDRSVVIHKADYVVPNYEGTGRSGRSDGCFAVNPANIEEVIDCLKDGSYFIAWHE